MNELLGSNFLFLWFTLFKSLHYLKLSSGSISVNFWYIFKANKLRAMLLGMVDDPRVVLIKLADRLHNMRTM